ncbi:DNA circularization protein [Billgrantia gudaonensis]|uniref:Mu-like prophage DNA circulation protein n=1 Tax=Billgrantia gudaonensis TaxID=376427 RepID=A0A1G9AZX0_9GAMM|nr:DNA circularization N-terminal domain-containing protein [Halomonas gudaonensis]SDK32250.1 Mu-like prophage DNA circulation protein [Halomonas gudaonensis]
MSWRDRIGPGTAEWRGVTLHLERGSISPGRRVQVHEYPLRPDPYAEDLGRKAREWQITGYLIGDDYDLQRNALAEALELPGAAEMRHSYYGTARVVVTDARITESTREGGMARVTLTVVRAGDEPRLPTAQADTQQVVEAEAEQSRLAILEEFEAAFEILALVESRVAAVESAIFGTIAEIESVVGDVTGTISRLIRTPGELGAAILSSIGQIKHMIGEPGRALGLYESLFAAGEDRLPGSIPNTAPLAAGQEASAKTAAIALIRRGAAIEAAEASAGWSLPTRQDAVEALEIVHDGLTQQLAGRVPPLPQTAQRLVALRAAAVTDLRRRGAALPELATHTPGAPLPALVIAHRLYGDATRDAEIVRRNQVRHPGRVPAERLEVLSE